MVYNRVNKRKTPFVNMKMNDGCLEIHSEVEWLRLLNDAIMPIGYGGLKTDRRR